MRILQRDAQAAAAAGTAEEEVFENERYMPIRGWASRGNLLPAERRRYSGRDGGRSANDFPSPPLPPGWGPVCSASCVFICGAS